LIQLFNIPPRLFYIVRENDIAASLSIEGNNLSFQLRNDLSKIFNIMTSLKLLLGVAVCVIVSFATGSVSARMLSEDESCAELTAKKKCDGNKTCKWEGRGRKGSCVDIQVPSTSEETSNDCESLSIKMCKDNSACRVQKKPGERAECVELPDSESSCALLMGMKKCTKEDDCSWNTTTRKCVEAAGKSSDEDGDGDNIDNDDDEADLSDSEGSCASLMGMKTCTKEDGCSWNTTTRKCVEADDFDDDDDDEADLSDSESSCASLMEIRKCKKEDACSWNTTTQKCVENGNSSDVDGDDDDVDDDDKDDVDDKDDDAEVDDDVDDDAELDDAELDDDVEDDKDDDVEVDDDKDDDA